MPEHFDVIIIGTGAGGGTLAHTLAPSGKRFLLLERGNFLPARDGELGPDPVFIDGRYISDDTWYDADGTAFQPQVHYFVGGATKLYGAALYRLRPQDFGELQHVDGLSPAWPVSYDDFEPYLHEGRVALPGARQPRRRPDRGTLDQAVPVARRLARAANPAVRRRPPARRLPPVPRALRHPARRSRPRAGAHASVARGATDTRVSSTPNPTRRRSRSGRARDPNVTLLVNAEVTQLETDPSGRAVTNVVVSRGGNREVYEADIVVVSAGAANSAKLLLRSANDQHPNGLANGSDQVGRNYMFHNSKAVVALSKEPNETVFQKTLGSTTSTSVATTTTGRSATSRWSASRTRRP